MSFKKLNQLVHLIRVVPGICFLVAINFMIAQNNQDFKLTSAIYSIFLIIMIHIISLLINVYYDQKNGVDLKKQVTTVIIYDSYTKRQIFPTILFYCGLGLVFGLLIVSTLTLKQVIFWSLTGVFYTLIYSLKPFEISKTFLGEIYNAFGFGFLIIEFSVFVNIKAFLEIRILLPVIFFYLGAVFIASSLDSEKDRVYRKTISVLIGQKKAKLMGLIFLVCCNLSFIFILKFSLVNATVFTLVNCICCYLTFLITKKQFTLKNKIKIMKIVNQFAYSACLLYILS